MIEIKNFSPSEFDCQSLKGSGGSMRISTLEMLQKARDIYGKPISVTSGFRTKSHNKKVRGVANSKHLTGYAVDLSAVSEQDKRELLKALYAVGFRRFGIMFSAIHVDNDPDAPQSVWHYDAVTDSQGRIIRRATNPKDWQLFGTLEKIKAL